MNLSQKTLKLALTVAFLALGPLYLEQQTLAAIREFKVVAVDAGGTKVWLPSVLVVKKGDKVKINAVSKVAAPSNVHGLAIKEFKIVEAVDEKGKTIEFTASKAGIFNLFCHLHEAHIGGQLVVMEN